MVPIVKRPFQNESEKAFLFPNIFSPAYLALMNSTIKSPLLWIALFFLLNGGVCVTDIVKHDPKLDELQIPEGFQIEFYAQNVENARSMVMSPSGTLFVGTRGKGNVYALPNTNGDNKADTVITILKDMNSPNGVALKDGDLYVAEINRVLRYDNVEQNLNDLPEPLVVNDKFPTEGHHGWKYIAFGPDGKLYVPVGAPCNICDETDTMYASITRMNADGSELEMYAHGVRNSVGFTWHPETQDMWFTDNGRDMMGNDIPNDELNHATEKGQHFGYPYCHAGDIPDPEFGGDTSCTKYRAPAQKLGPHVASLGLKFYTGNMFPEEYHGDIFIAEHGSWNRSDPIGYRITRVEIENGKAVNYSTFLEGWLDGNSSWGRPVDILVLNDGSMLVSDDHGDAIYRISYKP